MPVIAYAGVVPLESKVPQFTTAVVQKGFLALFFEIGVGAQCTTRSTARVSLDSRPFEVHGGLRGEGPEVHELPLQSLGSRTSRRAAETNRTRVEVYRRGKNNTSPLEIL